MKSGLTTAPQADRRTAQRLNSVKAAVRGRFFAALWVFVLFAHPAPAADFAYMAPIGFSPDGTVFAYEAYGTEDGSGFAYSVISVVDTATGADITGSPVRVRADDEERPLQKIREEAASDAYDLLTASRITEPARLLAAQPYGDDIEYQSRLDIAVPGRNPRAAPADRIALQLNIGPLERTETWCEDAVYLQLQYLSAYTTTILGEHRSDGENAPCVTGYGFHTVYFLENHPARPGIAVISVFQTGFEGSDRRFTALPVPIGPLR